MSDPQTSQSPARMLPARVASAGTRGNGVPGRYLFFLLVFLMYVISYGDRAALSIALPSLGREFGLTPVRMGWVSSSFLWSYFLLNLPSTMLLDIVGGRIVGTLAVSLWSGAMMLGGMALSLPQFLLTRVLLGIGEAPTFGIGATVVRNWARPTERGTVMTVLLTGMQVGLAAGTAVGAVLIAAFGWRTEFLLLGTAGLVWAAFWWLIYRDPVHRIGAPPRTALKPADIGRLFRAPSFIGILAGQCTQNYLNFLLMSWMPIYLMRTQAIDLRATGMRTAFCYVIAALGAVLLGRVLERLVFRRAVPAANRRYVVAACLTGAAGIGLLPAVHGVAPVLLLLSLSLCCLIAANGANTAMLTDLIEDGRKIGSITGLTLTVSNALGLLAPILTGYIVAATGSFDAAWYSCAVSLVLASLISLALVRDPIRLTGFPGPVGAAGQATGA